MNKLKWMREHELFSKAGNREDDSSINNEKENMEKIKFKLFSQ